jgi:hypothetical protein
VSHHLWAVGEPLDPCSGEQGTHAPQADEQVDVALFQVLWNKNLYGTIQPGKRIYPALGSEGVDQLGGDLVHHRLRLLGLILR